MDQLIKKEIDLKGVSVEELIQIAENFINANKSIQDASDEELIQIAENYVKKSHK